MGKLREKFLLGAAGMLALTACAAHEAPMKAPQQMAGWYNQSAGARTFQRCGSSEQWLVTQMADLNKRATAFGLQGDTPVYVKLSAVVSAPGKFGPQGTYPREVRVERVVQFGSPTPVRNCALTGVVYPSSSSTITSH